MECALKELLQLLLKHCNTDACIHDIVLCNRYRMVGIVKIIRPVCMTGAARRELEGHN